MLVGRPADVPGRATWEDTVKEVLAALEKMDGDLEWDGSETLPNPPGSCGINLRGKYRTCSLGPSFGGGQTVSIFLLLPFRLIHPLVQFPQNFSHKEFNIPVFEAFLENAAVERMAKVASSKCTSTHHESALLIFTGAMAFYAPKLYQYYCTTMKELYDSDTALEPPFKGSVFASMSPNPKKAVAHMHKDTGNLAFGWCGIQSLGHFDYKKGGHLILQELGLVVEFPPGSTILLPSASVTHGNTPIAAEETRSSLVHYSAGGLFRWVEYGCQKWEDFKQADPVNAAKAWDARTTTRVPFALSLFSKVDELLSDQVSVYN